jgi:hypothetical protein
VLYRYSSDTHKYIYLGQYLTGTTNSPYVNGFDYRLSRLHVSWCYRNFVAVPESTIPGAHKQQAGPNGPENNFDLNYAYSDNLGYTWRSSENKVLAAIKSSETFGAGNSIMPSSEGVRVFEIPMESGILNQEAQVVDWDGGFWALNREKISNQERWMVYYRNAAGRYLSWCLCVKKFLLHADRSREMVEELGSFGLTAHRNWGQSKDVR